MRRRPRNLLLLMLTAVALTGCQNTAVDSVPAEPDDPVPPAMVPASPDLAVEDADAAKPLVVDATTPDAQKVPPVMKNPLVKKVVRTAYNPLTAEEKAVILNKGTERMWVGEYTDLKAKGTFICRRCNAPLYTSDAKFDSECGWPSFDEDVSAAVERLPDPDGIRVEIVCANCGGHLGHVFEGEKLTAKDTRHCVNSISMKFVPEGQELPAVIVPEGEK